MINIAICDDDIAITGVIEEMLYKIEKEQNLQINCSIFFDGDTLIQNIHQGSYYDLIYMDIEMNRINGINTAEIIRNLDVPVLIIYISGYEKYLKELFHTEPFRFLSKPIDESEFCDVFMAAFKRIQQKTGYFSFSYNKTYIKVPLSSIYYFESKNRIVYIHMSENKNIYAEGSYDRFYGKMNEVQKQLSAYNSRFIRIHQSYLVNYDYIKSMNFTTVMMTNGTLLQISEERQKSVRTQYCSMAGIEV